MTFLRRFKKYELTCIGLYKIHTKMFRALNRKLMLSTVVRVTPTIIIPIFRERNENDENLIHDPDTPGPQTGWERLRTMYMRNEFDEVSIEINNVFQATFCGFFFGACLGGFAKSRDAYLHFMENNQATIFRSPLEAKKKLQDFVTVAFARGAYHWGWRLGIFSGIFSLIITSISVYRDQSQLSDYIIAGTFTGAIYKANLGSTAMLVGAALGGVLSTIGGVLVLGILKITGKSMDELRGSLYKIRETRKQQMDEGIEANANEKHDNLTLHHDIVLKEKGIQKIEELQ